MSCGLETQSINFSDFEKVVFKQVRQKDSFFVAGGLCSKKVIFFLYHFLCLGLFTYTSFAEKVFWLKPF